MMTSLNIPWQDRRKGARSYFLGERFPIVASGSSTNSTTITFNGILVGFSITASSYSDGDYFAFQMAGSSPIMENIYMKGAESFEFERPLILASGNNIEFIFNNTEGSNKIVYYDMEFNRDDL